MSTTTRNKLKFKKADRGNKYYHITNKLIKEKGKRTRSLESAGWISKTGKSFNFNQIPASYQKAVVEYYQKKGLKFNFSFLTSGYFDPKIKPAKIVSK